MNKIYSSVLAIIFVSASNAYAKQICNIGGTCDMANAPIIFTLDQGKKYTCHFELISHQLTTRYFLIGNDKLVKSDAFDLSYFSNPSVTKKDINIDTSTSDFGPGYNAIMFIRWDSHTTWGYETVSCNLRA